VAWKDTLVAAGNSPKGTRVGQLAAAKALFAYAVENDLIPANPAHGVKLRVIKGRAGSRGMPTRTMRRPTCWLLPIVRPRGRIGTGCRGWRR
jgi:hypothetical protein